jgi:serine kinase of HPr protein (carbohydrate metabolism regulator)
MLIHATCIALKGQGVLLAGKSGVGKSDLALRMINDGAQLVADDQTELRVENTVLIASASPSIAGLFEIRHVSLVKMSYLPRVPVTLYVELTPIETVLERMPEADKITLLDHPVRRLRLPSFAASTPAKIRAALLYSLSTDT